MLFFVHQKSKHVLSNVCTSSLLFIIMSDNAARSEENLDWSSNRQGSSRPKMSSVGEKKRRWMVLGIRRVHQNKGKEKARTVNKKKGGIVPISSDPRFLGVGSEDHCLLVGKQE
jgi:hypothetical protein